VEVGRVGTNRVAGVGEVTVGVGVAIVGVVEVRGGRVEVGVAEEGADEREDAILVEGRNSSSSSCSSSIECDLSLLEGANLRIEARAGPRSISPCPPPSLLATEPMVDER